MNAMLGKALYGATFAVAVPALLAVWAWRLDALGTLAWHQPLPRWLGLIAALAGLALVASSMLALWRLGGGLPMNAYPPPRLVTRAAYAWLAHPIYAGFFLCVAGVSVLADSPAGLWIVSPLTALGCAALVCGYEGPALRRRFGPRAVTPYFGVPPATAAPASRLRRVCAALTVFVPWAAIYVLLALMPPPDGATNLRLDFEARLPAQPWAFWIYTAAYPFSALAPLALRSHAELRRFVVAGSWASAVGFLLMVFVPGRADFLPVPSEGVEAWLAQVNRSADAAWLAMPSFHVLWAFIAAFCYASARPALARAAAASALLIAASSWMAGAHALVDVIGGAGIAYLCWHYERTRTLALFVANRLANSLSEWRVGRARILSHWLWSAAAMSVGAALAMYLAGPAFTGTIGLICLASLAGAGIWGYAFEGGTRLSRPFGYFGGLLGAALALAIVYVRGGIEPFATLAASLTIGGALTQVLGRGRCLVQGCCHGRPTPSGLGIRVTNPLSRVVSLARLEGLPIHATQLYSMIAGAIIAIVLSRLGSSGAASGTAIAAAYLVLISISRFAEEGYRGEPQTLHIAGLPVYQWFAIVMLLCGVALSAVSSPPFIAAAALPIESVAVALLLGVVAALALSVDAPESGKPLSRLTVTPGQCEPPDPGAGTRSYTHEGFATDSRRDA